MRAQRYQTIYLSRRKRRRVDRKLSPSSTHSRGTQKKARVIEMSRNDGKKDTSATAFRKIDVDQYSDNNFKEEDADGGMGAPTGPDENEILTLLSQYPLRPSLLSRYLDFKISLFHLYVSLTLYQG